MANDGYPYDPEVRQRVVELLYELLPALYRVRDEAPKGRGDLRRFLSILAAPLAVVRQSVQELHADFFIDSSSDWVLPYLAEMVGTTLAFPDAASNRRDVRSTATWRRRKGTPSTVEDLGTELLGHAVSTQEGWKRLLITQDVNVPRLERTVPDVRSLLLAEATTGPLDAAFHALDAQPITARSGRYHPRHVTHWLHPTQLFTVRRGTACQLGTPSSPRYAFHPQGARQELRRARGDEPLRTDRIPRLHFAQAPERHFGQEGGFTVFLCGLPAAVAQVEAPTRQASSRSAGASLVAGPAKLSLLERGSKRATGSVSVELHAVPLGATGDVALWSPRLDSAALRGGLTLTQTGSADSTSPFSPMAGPHVPMLRLAPVLPAREAWFPGATVELVSGDARALLGSEEPALAAEGFLRGALLVRLPALWITGEQWVHVAADGSLRDASRQGQLLPVRKNGTGWWLEGEVLSASPGAAWPPASPRATDELLSQLPASPYRGPVFMHGGRALRPTGESVPPGTRLALAFAARYESRSGPRYHPFLRLEWKGSDPAVDPICTAIGSRGQPVRLPRRFRQIEQLRSKAPPGLHLVVRLEGDEPGLLLPPCEIALASADGEPLLLHLPELSTRPMVMPDRRWQAGLPAVGAGVSIAADGSARVMGSEQIARYALGDAPVAPISRHATLRRRRVRGSELSHPVPAGFLDIDPLQGLFALAPDEPVQAYPVVRLDPAASGSQGQAPMPPAVTVDYQQGYSSHIGALPAPREPLLGVRQPAPTRRVLGGGALIHAVTGPSLAPYYPSLTEALRAIDSDPSPAEHEVIQIEDSATYQEAPQWPSNEGKRLSRLTIQAAERERPLLMLSSWAPPARPSRYARLTLRGLFLSGSPIVFPAAGAVDVQFCTVGGAEERLVFVAPGRDASVEVFRSLTAGLELRGPGMLSIKDSVVDAGQGQALLAPEATCELSRATVIGASAPFILEATDSIFDGAVTVTDRFHGCIRYSRVEADSVLPRRHRLAEGVEVRFVSRDRNDPAHARLAGDCDLALLLGAEDGAELGAFHDVRLPQRTEALERRLAEYTPAGRMTGILRLD